MRTPAVRQVAMLGLGEAGGRLAADLVQLGVEVVGWDPAARPVAAGVSLAGSGSEAVRGADLVLSANSARAAVEVGREVVAALRPGAMYADLNTASPAVKEELGALLEGSGALFVDAALMAPVARAGIRTPCLASGPGAEAFQAAVADYGMPVETVPGPPGAASARKLLRSVFTKGMAAAAVEAMAAASALGCEEWLRAELESELEAQGAEHLQRLLEGSRRHARRRIDEMKAARDLLRTAGVEPLVSVATLRLLERLAGEAESRAGRR